MMCSFPLQNLFLVLFGPFLSAFKKATDIDVMCGRSGASKDKEKLITVI